MGGESNGYADALARKSITTCSDVADTSINCKAAGPEGGRVGGESARRQNGWRKYGWWKDMQGSL